MDINLLLQRGKLAGKAFLHGGGGASFSCRSVEPDVAFYNPRDVEFSCSDTPAFTSILHVPSKRNKNKKKKLDAASVAKAFEMLNLDMSDASAAAAATPSPSPAMWGFGRSPTVVRQLRITDSPFPIKEEGEVVDVRVDKEADDFIKRFYEQLKKQKLLPPTPEYGEGSRRRRPVTGRA